MQLTATIVSSVLMASCVSANEKCHVYPNSFCSRWGTDVNDYTFPYEAKGGNVPATANKHETASSSVNIPYHYVGYLPREVSTEAIQRVRYYSCGLIIRKQYQDVWILSNFGDRSYTIVWLDIDLQGIPKTVVGTREQLTKGVTERLHCNESCCRNTLQQTFPK